MRALADAHDLTSQGLVYAQRVAWEARSKATTNAEGVVLVTRDDLTAGGTPWAALVAGVAQAMADNTWTFTLDSVEQVCIAANAQRYYDEHVKSVLPASLLAQLKRGGGVTRKAERTIRTAALLFVQHIEQHSERADLVTGTLSKANHTIKKKIQQYFGYEKSPSQTARINGKTVRD